MTTNKCTYPVLLSPRTGNALPDAAGADHCDSLSACWCVLPEVRARRFSAATARGRILHKQQHLRLRVSHHSSEGWLSGSDDPTWFETNYNGRSPMDSSFRRPTGGGCVSPTVVPLLPLLGHWGCTHPPHIFLPHVPPQRSHLPSYPLLWSLGIPKVPGP